MITLLYVDDEPALRDIGRLFLERSGEMLVDTASCADEAITRLGSRRYDAIVSDYQMPGLDGLELLTRLRSGGNTTPFLLFTGKGREDVVIEALNNGADFYIQKGGDPKAQFAELSDKIEKAVERKRDRERIRRYNRALRMIVECSQIMVREHDEQQLLQQICERIISPGGYRFTWVGRVCQDEAKTIVPLAYAGFEEGYLSSVTVTWADSEAGRGHTRNAILSKKPAIARNLNTDFNAAWRDEAGRRGYESSIAIPLFSEGPVWGILKIYAIEPDAFDEEEVELLTQLAVDMAFGMDSLMGRKEKTDALRAYEISDTLYRSIAEERCDPIIRFRPDGGITFVNQAFVRYFGIPPDDAQGTDLFRFIPAEDRTGVLLLLKTLTPMRPTVTSGHNVVRNNREMVFSRSSFRGVFDKEGKPVEYQVLSRLGKSVSRSPESAPGPDQA